MRSEWSERSERSEWSRRINCLERRMYGASTRERSTRTKVINTRTNTRTNTRMGTRTNTRMEVFIVEKKTNTPKSVCNDVSRYLHQSYRLCLWLEMMNVVHPTSVVLPRGLTSRQGYRRIVLQGTLLHHILTCQGQRFHCL